MFSMKRLLLIALLTVSFFACGGQKRYASGGKEPYIGFVMYKYGDTFVSGLRRAIEQTSEGKAIVVTQESKNSRMTQDSVVEGFLEEGVDALIVNPVDITATSGIIGKAREKNVPIVFVNREPDPADMKIWDRVYYVGSLAFDAGRMATEIMISYFKENPAADLNKDGVIQYVVLMGEPGSPDAVLRTQAYTDTFVKSKAHGGIAGQELASETAMWERTLAEDKMKAMLNAFPNRIEAVFANSDEMALGAIDALRKFGYFSEATRKKVMPIVGIDATTEGVEAVSQGTLVGTVLNSSYSQGVDALNIALALVEGTDPGADLSVPLTGPDGMGKGRYVWVPHQKVTRDNYQNFLKKQF